MTQDSGSNTTSGNALTPIDVLKRCIAPKGSPEKKLISINLFTSRIFQVSVSLISYTSDNSETYFINVPDEEARKLEEVGTKPNLLISPWIAAEAGYKFYASAALSDGALNIGSLCLLDKKARKFSASQQGLLNNLAAIASQVINSRTIMFLIAASGFFAQDLLVECVDVILI